MAKEIVQFDLAHFGEKRREVPEQLRRDVTRAERVLNGMERTFLDHRQIKA